MKMQITRVRKKVILTVHDGLDLVYRSEDEWLVTFGGVDEAKLSTAKAWRGHDFLQSKALLALTLLKLPPVSKRDAHFS